MCCGSYLACRKAQLIQWIIASLLPTASGSELGLLDPLFFCWNCGRNPANHSRLVAYPTNYFTVFSIQVGCKGGFLNHQQWKNGGEQVKEPPQKCSLLREYSWLPGIEPIFFWGLWNYQNSPSNLWWEECSVRLAFVKGFGAWSLLLWCRCPWDVGLMGLWICGPSLRDTL